MNKKMYLVASLLTTIVHSSQVIASESSIIEQTMSYPLTDVIKRYKDETGFDDAKVHEVERELRRFLALCALYPKQDFAMGSEIVDNLWHNFILFTPEYTEFCNQIAGEFLHHVPNTGRENPEDMIESYKNFLGCYQQTFNEKAPEHIWPQPNIIKCKVQCVRCNVRCRKA